MDNKRRKLKSRNSSEQDVEIVDLPCVQGGWLKEPRVLPLVDKGSKGKFVQVTSKDTWLHEVLAGEKSSSSCREALAACLSELRHACTGLKSAASDLPEMSVAESIREKLAASGLSGEDSEDAESERSLRVQDSRSASSARPVKRDKTRSSDNKLVVRNVHLKEHDVLATLCKNRILLLYSPENLQNFLSLAKLYSPEDAEEKKHEKAERRQHAPGDTHFH